MTLTKDGPAGSLEARRLFVPGMMLGSEIDDVRRSLSPTPNDSLDASLSSHDQLETLCRRVSSFAAETRAAPAEVSLASHGPDPVVAETGPRDPVVAGWVVLARSV
jgi:hypothetical protein